MHHVNGVSSPLITCRGSCHGTKSVVPQPQLRISAAQDPSRHSDGLPFGHLDDFEPTAGSDIVPADILALHPDQQDTRIGDLEAVEYAIVPRFTVAE